MRGATWTTGIRAGGCRTSTTAGASPTAWQCSYKGGDPGFVRVVDGSSRPTL
jgi:hypothetical protein